VKPMCGVWIEPGEKTAHTAGSPLFAIRQSLPHRLVAFRQMGEAIQQSPQIETRSANDHRKTAAYGNFFDNISGDTGVLTCGVTVRRVQHVQQVMGYTAALGLGRFGGADVKAPVELEGIAIDDFA